MATDSACDAETAASIIDFIRRNRVSTTEVADALGKHGALSGPVAVNTGHHRVGPVHWAYAYDHSNWSVHEQIAAAPAGSIVVISHHNTSGRSAVGDLVAKFLILYRQCHALVVQGPVRDADQMRRNNWPLWCEGFNPVGCTNDKPTSALPPGALDTERERFSGAVAVCDDGGVVIIEARELTDQLLDSLERIEALEDEWYDGIDRLKLSTFEVVCLRKAGRRESDEPRGSE